MNFRHALRSILMNSVSSSLSVYQGPPVTSTLGSRWNSMYIFRVGCYLCLCLCLGVLISECVQQERERGVLRTWTVPFTAFTSCFWVSDFRHLSITVWCSSVLTLMCFVHIPKQTILSFLVVFCSYFEWRDVVPTFVTRCWDMTQDEGFFRV